MINHSKNNSLDLESTPSTKIVLNKRKEDRPCQKISY
ncbi:hypothetical protein AF67_07630 [Streptococcus uberis 6780]|nr:hypothetical protein AF67_07630 [Streptococcus uberis 6780]